MHFQQIEFLRLSEKRILLVIVAPDGDVQNRLMLTEIDYTPAQLVQAANYINQHYAGLSFDDVRIRLKEELKQLQNDMTRLMQAAVEAGSDAMTSSGEDIVISGERNLLSIEDLSSNMSSLRKLFDIFEQKTTLTALLDMSSKATGVQIFIGGESQLMPLESMSVVTAPYEANGKIVGTLGVIGPTRMAYERDSDCRHHGKAAVERSVASLNRQAAASGTVRTVILDAVTVQSERMLGELETSLLGDTVLTFFNFVIKNSSTSPQSRHTRWS